MSQCPCTISVRTLDANTVGNSLSSSDAFDPGACLASKPVRAAPLISLTELGMQNLESSNLILLHEIVEEDRLHFLRHDFDNAEVVLLDQELVQELQREFL